ncbi:MAG: hypothetical protein ACRDT6_05195 [Micromonosporaceae bacterium]
MTSDPKLNSCCSGRSVRRLGRAEDRVEDNEVVISRPEMRQARADRAVHGVAEESQRTYVEIRRYTELVGGGIVDWATLGAVTSVLLADHVHGGDHEQHDAARRDRVGRGDKPFVEGHRDQAPPVILAYCLK